MHQSMPKDTVVLKYAKELDQFIRVRDFGDDDEVPFLKDLLGISGQEYIRRVIEGTILSVNDATVRALLKKAIKRHPEVIVSLYSLATDVNRSLDIHYLSSTPEGGHVAGEEESGIYIPRLDIDPIPLARKRAGHAAYLQAFRKRFLAEVAGQPHSVDPLCRTVARYLCGLKDPQKPESYAFLGPSGVGKTQTAKVVAGLAGELFPGGFLRVDCAEYANPHEYAKLIGSPPGYIGHLEGGFLTEALKENGRLVILFDELEKADPKMYNILLSMLDEGAITNSKGERMDCSDSLIMLTSNSGSSEWSAMMHSSIGFSPKIVEQSREQVFLDAFAKVFPSYFRGRIDNILIYNSIDEASAIKIAQLQMKRVVRPYAVGKKVNITFTPTVAAKIAEWSDYREFGGRDMRRVAEQLIDAPLLDLYVEGKLKEGDKVLVGLGAGRNLRFTKNAKDLETRVRETDA